jgi:hypothetical protein
MLNAVMVLAERWGRKGGESFIVLKMLARKPVCAAIKGLLVPYFNKAAFYNAPPGESQAIFMVF